MKNLQVLAILLFLLPFWGNSQGNDLTSITAKYDTFFEEINTSYAVLTQRSGVTEVASVGQFELDEHSVFNIGSATKKMTAILILQEVEKGSIGLTDSIGTYLSPIKNVDGSLTIESLLRHRSGLAEYLGAEFEALFFNASDSIYNANLFDLITPADPERVGAYNYCNTNYLLLGRIIEKITDQSYFDLLRERIFVPCGMTESYPYVSKSITNLVHPIHKGQDVYEYMDYRFFSHFANAAGSVASTLQDQAKFYAHLFTKKTLINQNSLDQLIAFDDADYGLGMMKLEINDGLYYGHGGTNLGYSYREYYNPINGDLTILFTNSYNIPFHKLMRDEILNGVSTIEFRDNVVEDFQANIGTYFMKEMDTELGLAMKDGQMVFEVQGQSLPMVSIEINKLFAPEYGIELEMKPDNLDEIIFRQNGMEATITRVIESETSKN